MPRTAKFYLIGVGLAAAIVYLVISAIQATGVPYRQVHELGEYENRGEVSVKVTGKVKPGTLDYDPHAPTLTFEVQGPEGHSLDVRYRGIKPDAMREEGHVILEGTYRPEQGRLRAHTLLAKCPSRYESEYRSYRPSD